MKQVKVNANAKANTTGTMNKKNRNKNQIQKKKLKKLQAKKQKKLKLSEEAKKDQKLISSNNTNGTAEGKEVEKAKDQVVMDTSENAVKKETAGGGQTNTADGKTVDQGTKKLQGTKKPQGTEKNQGKKKLKETKKFKGKKKLQGTNKNAQGTTKPKEGNIAMDTVEKAKETGIKEEEKKEDTAMDTSENTITKDNTETGQPDTDVKKEGQEKSQPTDKPQGTGEETEKDNTAMDTSENIIMKDSTEAGQTDIADKKECEEKPQVTDKPQGTAKPKVPKKLEGTKQTQDSKEAQGSKKAKKSKKKKPRNFTKFNYPSTQMELTPQLTQETDQRTIHRDERTLYVRFPPSLAMQDKKYMESLVPSAVDIRLPRLSPGRFAKFCYIEFETEEETVKMKETLQNIKVNNEAFFPDFVGKKSKTYNEKEPRTVDPLRLYIGGLPKGVHANDIRTAFPTAANFIYRKANRKFRESHAYLTFKTHEEALKVFNDTKGLKVLGKDVMVMFSSYKKRSDDDDEKSETPVAKKQKGDEKAADGNDNAKMEVDT